MVLVNEGIIMKKIRKYLLIGLMGAFITVIGELSGGLSATIDMSNRISQVMSSFDNLPVWRIGFCSTVGAIGIYFQYFGYKALQLSLKNQDGKLAKCLKYGNYGFIIYGALDHVVLCMLIYVYHMTVGLPNQWAIIWEFSQWFVLPIVIIFFIGYFTYGIALFIAMIRGETMFSKWYCLANPLIGKMVINAIYGLNPGTVFMNGINFASVGLSSLVIFALFLFVINKKLKEVEN